MKPRMTNEMNQTPKKLVLIGIDSATLDILDRFIAEDKLPHIKNLMRRGIVSEAYPCLPTGTAMNWKTIVTGACSGTHGITAMEIHEKGDPLDETESGFYANKCKMDHLWDVAEKQGKISLLLRYTGSWPPTLKKGMVVDGFGNPDWHLLEIANRLCFTTEDLGPDQMAVEEITSTNISSKKTGVFKIRISPARNWTDLPSHHPPPLEATIKFPSLKEKKYYLLLIGSSGKGYEKIVISPQKDFKKAVDTISVGRWGRWIKSDFLTDRGEITGIFRFKLIELSKDGKTLTLFTSQIFPEEGWTKPESLAKGLVETIGPYQDNCNLNYPYYWGWVDENTILEEVEYHVHWLEKAAQHLMKNHPWDLFLTQLHHIDHLAHAFLGGMDPECSLYNPKRAMLCESAMRKAYELADGYVGRVLENVDEGTLIIVISDHGHFGVKKVFFSENFMVKNGLTIYHTDPKTGRRVIDWTKTKAVIARRGTYLYVNLKGRDPQGIVSPGEEYERLRQKIVQLFQGVQDPETGDYVTEIGLRKEDAGFLGLYGDRVGDIVYFLKPDYTEECGRFLTEDLEIVGPPKFPDKKMKYIQTGIHHPHLPSHRRGKVGRMPAVVIVAGPGIRKGMRRPEPISLLDITPTICYFLGITPPSLCEGSVRYDFFQEHR